MLDNRALVYCIITTAVIIGVLTSMGVAYDNMVLTLASIAVVVASITAGVLTAYTYTGEYLRARDIVPLTSVMGFGLGYLIGISASAIVYGLRGRLLDLALLGVNAGYIVLLVLSIMISYLTGLAVYPKVWRARRYGYRRAKRARRR